MKNNEIGNRIRQLRIQKGLTQLKLANDLGFSSAATVSGWENGTKNLSADQVVGVAEYFGVSTDYLLLGATSQEESSYGSSAKRESEEIMVYPKIRKRRKAPHLVTLVIALLAMLLVFNHRLFPEEIKVGMLALWAVIFFIFAVDIFAHPLRVNRVINIDLAKEVFYQHALGKKKMHRAMAERRLVLGLMLVLSLVNLYALLAGAMKDFDSIIQNFLIIAWSLAIFLTGSVIYRVEANRLTRVRIKHFELKDIHMRDTLNLLVLIHGATFVIFQYYAMLVADKPELLHTRMSGVLFLLCFMLSLNFRYEHHAFVSGYRLNLDHE
ncbi:MAG: helix-turn-helix domain-containing protein [Acholeplasmataceae bacterium]